MFINAFRGWACHVFGALVGGVWVVFLLPLLLGRGM